MITPRSSHTALKDEPHHHHHHHLSPTSSFNDDAEFDLDLYGDKTGETVENTAGDKEGHPEDSTYELVRNIVSSHDEPDMPVITFRFWLMATVCTVVLGFMNQLFSLRTVSMTFPPLLFLFAIYPIGLFLAWALPKRKFRTFGYEWSFNPGPFNIKEHVLTTIAIGTAGTASNTGLFIVSEQVMAGHTIPVVSQIFLLLSSALLSLAMAASVRNVMVKPTFMIWPTVLAFVSVFRSLHDNRSMQRGMTPLTILLIATVANSVYEILPQFVFMALTSMSWVCWAFPNSGLAHQLGSGTRGLGLGSFSLHWGTITAFLGSPIVMPLWITVNLVGGGLLILWVVLPAVYYTNTLDAWTYPILSTLNYDEFGQMFNTTAVLDPETGEFSKVLAEEYSELRLSVSYALLYGFSVATTLASVSYVALYYGRNIWSLFRNHDLDDADVHTRLMRRYKKVPHVWYAGLYVLCLVMSVIAVEVYDLGLPWIGVVLAPIFGFILIIPVGIMYAVTTLVIDINVLAQMIAGFMFPHKPAANLLFKLFMFHTLLDAVLYLGDMKLTHYMKISPRASFIAFFYGIVLASLGRYGSLEFAFRLIGDLCDPEGKWDCGLPLQQANAAVIWGLVGPSHVFGPNAFYGPVMYLALIGFLLPFPFYYLSKRFPRSWVAYVHIPAIFFGGRLVPPMPASTFVSFLVVGVFFNYYLFRYRHAFWMRYAYVISAGLSLGLVITSIFVFSALENVSLAWWGNDLLDNCPYVSVPYAEFQSRASDIERLQVAP